MFEYKVKGIINIIQSSYLYQFNGVSYYQTCYKYACKSVDTQL